MWSATCNLAQGHQVADVLCAAPDLIFQVHTMQEISYVNQYHGFVIGRKMWKAHLASSSISSLLARARSYCRWPTQITIQPHEWMIKLFYFLSWQFTYFTRKKKCIKRWHLLDLQTENCFIKAVTKLHLFLNCFLQWPFRSRRLFSVFIPYLTGHKVGCNEYFTTLNKHKQSYQCND